MEQCSCYRTEKIVCKPNEQEKEDPVCKYVLPPTEKKASDFLPDAPFDDRTIYKIEFTPKKPCKMKESVPESKACALKPKSGSNLLDGPPLPEPMESKYDNEYVSKPNKCISVFQCKEREEKLNYSEKQLLQNKFDREMCCAEKKAEQMGRPMVKPSCCCQSDSAKNVKKVISQAKIDSGLKMRSPYTVCKPKTCQNAKPVSVATETLPTPKVHFSVAEKKCCCEKDKTPEATVIRPCGAEPPKVVTHGCIKPENQFKRDPVIDIKCDCVLKPIPQPQRMIFECHGIEMLK